MSSRGYTVLGWITWKIANRIIKRKLDANRSKVAALAVVVGVVLAGIALAGDDG